MRGKRVRALPMAVGIGLIIWFGVLSSAGARDRGSSASTTSLTSLERDSAEEPAWVWSSAADLPTPRVNHHQARLPDGRALIFSGVELPGHRLLSTTDIYDSSKNEWQRVEGLPSPVPGVHVVNTDLIQSQDGTILAVAFWSRPDDAMGPLRRGSYLYVFDEAGRWNEIDLPPLALEVFGTTGGLPVMDTPMPGMLITAGGSYSSGARNLRSIDSVLMYDFSRDLWESRAPLNQRRSAAAGLGLSDGRFLVTAGMVGDVVEDYPDPLRYLEYLTSTEIYDPSTDEWVVASDAPIWPIYGTSFRMGDGRVLLFGGQNSTAVALYEPDEDLWRRVGETLEPGNGLSIVQASSGEVLIAGGGDQWLEVFDPTSEDWSSIELPDGMESDETITMIEEDIFLITGFGDTSAAILHREDRRRSVFVPLVVRNR